MRFIRILMMMALMLGGSVAWGRTVTGTVVDAETGEPLPYSVVWLTKDMTGKHTDENGYFEIDVRDDSDSLKVSYMNYERASILAANLCDSRKPTSIALRCIDKRLGEVTVRPPKKVKRKKVGKKKAGGLIVLDFLALRQMDIFQGASIGFGNKIEEEGKRAWLTDAGIYIVPDSLMLSDNKFRLNIYDVSESPNEHKIAHTKNVTPYPIIFEYKKENVKRGKVRFTLPEPILLPDKAVVELEMLREPNLETEKWFYKNNIFARGANYARIIGDRWINAPISFPVYFEYEVAK